MVKKKKSAGFNFDEVFKHFDDLFFWVEDANDSSITYSDNFLAVTGYSTTELSERGGWLSIIVGDDVTSYRKSLDKWLLNPEGKTIKLDYRIIRKDDRIINVSEKIKLVSDKNGKVINKIGVISDVSEYIQSVENLKTENQQLELINSSKDSFLSVLSHDLRAPFTSILGFAEIILNETKLPDKDKAEYVKFIYDSSNNQLRLINHLFDWSQIQTGKVKTDIQRLHALNITYVCISYLTAQAFRKNININVNIPDSFHIDADERLVTKIFMNIISNAIKYSHENESVEISANIYNNNFTEFIIKDKGVGISEINRDKIFNIGKLFSTEGTKGEKGSGLGLILSRLIVEKHGGEIWFFSTEGKGSEFHFTLPSAESYILLVINDAEALQEIEDGVKNNYPNLQILKAENGFEAIEIISSKSPSLVVIEHDLPLMDGLQLIKSTINKHKNIRIPFIVFIDSASEDVVSAYQELNVKIIKDKPALTELLNDKIESLIFS
ncbi:MAG: Adaptive-response sensory-kinase SasA [Ignavibacteriaceae bacterium]|nr:Adaptive-response sensory-kinase SasA [Ignavibacteriaceae bacterium]